MADIINRLDNGTIELKLTVPWPKIQAEVENQVKDAIEAAELPGFRKGKAPRNLVEAKLDKNDLYSHAIQHLLPDVYAQAIKTYSLKPILYPKVSITKGEENEDWEFTASTCEAPVVNLTFPIKLAKDLKELSQKLDALRTQAQVKIPDLLVEEESNHRLSSLAENVTKLGLDIPTYLQSKKLTAENLKAQTAAEARVDLETEFILEKVKSEQKLADRKATLDFLKSLV